MKFVGVIVGALLCVLFFTLGWASSTILATQGAEGIETPLSSGLSLEPLERITGQLGITSAPEQPSPGDWISEDRIHVYDDKIVIDVEGARWAKFTDTNSMDPLFDESANTLKIMPAAPEDVHVGDIISYRTKNGVIIHRVIATGYDDEGWFAIAKGDNLQSPDPSKVRFEQLEGVTFGIIY